ncbi:MAG: PA2779 family protein [Candidatus Rokuibacteriota bacterium]
MRRRALMHPRVVVPVLAWAMLLGLLPHVADGAPLPPGAAAGAAGDPARLESRLVAAHLVALGVSPAEATARVAALTPEEREELARRLDEVGAGGNAATAVAVAIIIGLLVVLILELMGRRVISRP